MRTFIFLTFIFLIAVTGCATQKVERSRDAAETRVEYRERLRTDSVSVYLRDSIFVRVGGDTVVLEKYKTQILYRERLRVDTVSVSDTVRITSFDVKIEETNILTGWQNFQVWLGRIVVALIAIYLLFKKYLK